MFKRIPRPKRRRSCSLCSSKWPQVSTYQRCTSKICCKPISSMHGYLAQRQAALFSGPEFSVVSWRALTSTGEEVGPKSQASSRSQLCINCTKIASQSGPAAQRSRLVRPLLMHVTGKSPTIARPLNRREGY